MKFDRICIDPGHQLHPNFCKELIAPQSSKMKFKCAPGVIGIRTKVSEQFLNLCISKKLADLLLNEGTDVVLTREEENVDISNIQRAEIANKSSADLCIKIHRNGIRNSLKFFGFLRSGIQTLCPTDKYLDSDICEKSKVIGYHIHRRLVLHTKLKNLGIVYREDITSFNWSKIPSILLELGYLTNKNDEKLLIDDKFQEKICLAIYEGLKNAEKDNS